MGCVGPVFESRRSHLHLTRPDSTRSPAIRDRPDPADHPDRNRPERTATTTTPVLSVEPQATDMEPVNLEEAFASFDDHWSPRLAGELNGQAVKLATVEGEFVWHDHDDADELFLVVEGELRIEFRDEPDATLEAGEFLIVPAGVEHRPVAEAETDVLLFEPAGTRNTGDVDAEVTSEVARLDRDG
jgi:mannose-6-phosphate isomerase-like protein (cupin superfamily)